MDSVCFNEWLLFSYKHVKVHTVGPWLLILDNFSGHDQFLYLDNVHHWFLPQNTTALYQSMYQGIIMPLKVYYRTSLLRELIDELDRIACETAAGI